MLNLNLEKSTFVKNRDNTYTVYQTIGKRTILKLPRVSIKVEAYALSDEQTGEIFELLENNTSSGLELLKKKIKSLFGKGDSNI